MNERAVTQEINPIPDWAVEYYILGVTFDEQAGQNISDEVLGEVKRKVYNTVEDRVRWEVLWFPQEELGDD